MTSRERAKLHSLKSAWHADPVRIARKVSRAPAGLPPESERVIVSEFVAHVDQLLARAAATYAPQFTEAFNRDPARGASFRDRLARGIHGGEGSTGCRQRACWARRGQRSDGHEVHHDPAGSRVLHTPRDDHLGP